MPFLFIPTWPPSGVSVDISIGSQSHWPLPGYTLPLHFRMCRIVQFLSRELWLSGGTVTPTSSLHPPPAVLPHLQAAFCYKQPAHIRSTIARESVGLSARNA